MNLSHPAVLAEDATHALLETDFVKEMVRQLRALDRYGRHDGKPAASLLEPLILTRERKAQIPVVGDPDETTLACVEAFYNAIAALIEKECGLFAVSLVHLTNEGFGRVVITVGKLVVVDRTLRDVHRFGFDSLSKMKTEADKHLSVALEIVGKYSEVAGL